MRTLSDPSKLGGTDSVAARSSGTDEHGTLGDETRLGVGDGCSDTARDGPSLYVSDGVGGRDGSGSFRCVNWMS
jgi:hypothetical protein